MIMVKAADEREERSLLEFIDKYCQLGFLPRFDMREDKAMKLLRARTPNPKPLGINWVSRFLDCHPKYKSKFLRHS